MKRSITLVLGFVLVALVASPAWAQRGRNAGVTSVYGQFSAAEMHQAGGDPFMASQMREQRQMMQYQQQMFKQQQQFMQLQAKQQEYLKKHPEAAQAQKAPVRTTKKAASKTSKKGTATPTTTAAGANPTTGATSPLDEVPGDSKPAATKKAKAAK